MKKCSTEKLFKTIRLSVFHVMLAIVFCCFVTHTANAQILDQEITLKLNDVSFETALKEIETVAKVKFVFSSDQLSVREPVSIEVNKQSLRDALNKLLDPLKITYKVHEKEGAITLKKKNGVSSKDQSLLEDGTNGHGSDPSVIPLTGTVTDAATQQPMAGVNIIIRGSTIGTTTDSDGKYSINAISGDILIFSFIGYQSFETRVNEQPVIDVVLQEDIMSLKEVVINAGYYNTSKATQTGNIGKIGAKEIEKQPVSNPLAALMACVPGLEITQQNGLPGGNFTVRIRGQNSIGSGNDPLFIIDGVPYTSGSFSFAETSGELLPGGSSPLNYINPNDIESIEVLKDAAATSIYGSRGANGIILITTKKGQEGTKVSLSFYRGVSKVGHFADLLNSQQYIEMRKEGFANDNRIMTASNAPDLLLWDTTHYTNWQKKLIGGAGNTTDAQVSLSGGDKLTQFIISTGYHKETTVFPGDNDDQRISTHFNLSNTSPNQKLKSTVSINYSVLNSKLGAVDLTKTSLELAPVAPALYDSAGNLNWENLTWTNPLSYLRKKYEAHTTNLIGNVSLRYEIIPGLEIKVNAGYTNTAMKAITVTPNSFYGPPQVAQYIQHQSAFTNSSFQNWIVEPQLNWKKDFDFGQFDVLIGTSFLEQIKEGSSLMGKGFASEVLMKNIGAATDRTSGTNFYSQYRYHAVFGRINYIVKKKYILDLTARRDGSSRFGPGRQFANFGAVGAAWVFSNEDLIKSLLSFLSFGKLRISYGITGNDQIGDYEYLDSYTSSVSYMGSPALVPSRLYNTDFAWEVNKKFEAGLEWGLFDERVIGSVSHYRNRSSSQLIGYPLPPTTGFSSIRSNFAAVIQNTGTEIEFSTVNFKTKKFNWVTSFNLSVPRNKLVEFPDLEASAYANTLAVGEPLSIRKLYRYTGINQQTGVYTFEDVNGDGSYNQADRTTIKFVGKNLLGGLSNRFEFAGFQLDILFQFVKQTGYDFRPGTPGGRINQPVSVMDRWQAEGNATDVQRFGTLSSVNTPYSRFSASQEAFVDASFVRLKNLALSYAVPAWTKKLFLQNARLFIQGQNLVTITDYKGLDPESPGTMVLPPLRTITGGLNLTF